MRNRKLLVFLVLKFYLFYFIYKMRKGLANYEIKSPIKVYIQGGKNATSV